MSVSLRVGIATVFALDPFNPFGDAMAACSVSTLSLAPGNVATEAFGKLIGIDI